MHLALIIDSFFSMTESQYIIPLIQHLQSLVANKRINTFIPLKEFFMCDFDCACGSCIEKLIKNDFPSLIEKFNLSIIKFPELHDINTQPSNSTMPKSSVLAHPDPFTVLGITYTDSKPIIMQKMMGLIQQSPDKMAVFRQAQSEVFNPAKRFLHHYLRSINYEKSRPTQLDEPPLSKIKASSLNDIPFRHDLYNAN